MKVALISLTAPVHPELPSAKAEDLIVYTARVSNPSNQTNLETGPKLIRYLIDHKHFSPFEMVHMTLEIETSRAIAAQILRHRSFTFQEFSQRYSEAPAEFEWSEARAQGSTNRQVGDKPASSEDRDWWFNINTNVEDFAVWCYREALARGIAREQARMLLPLSVRTRLYMTGSVRSWTHYLEARCAPETQLEHREVAQAARLIFMEQFPITSSALWGEQS